MNLRCEGKLTVHAVCGHAPVPARQILKELCRRFQTAVIDEYFTSKKCPDCGGWLRATRTDSIRYYRCEFASSESAEQNKDYCAALSMLQIGLRVALTGARPAPWRRPPPKTEASAHSASSGGKSAAASAAKQVRTRARQRAVSAPLTATARTRRRRAAPPARRAAQATPPPTRRAAQRRRHQYVADALLITAAGATTALAHGRRRAQSDAAPMAVDGE